MVSLQKTIDEYLAHLRCVRNLSKATLASYGNDLRLFRRYLSGQGITEVERVSRDTFQQYINNQQATSPLKPATIRRRGHAIMSFFKFCCAMGYIRSSPLDGVQLPKKEKKLPKIFSDAEYDLFLTTPIRYRNQLWLVNRDTVAIQLLAIAALRFSEVRDLKVQDVDLDRQSMLINGKGAKQRYIPLHPTLAKSIREYLSVRRKAKHDYLLLANNGRARLGKTGLYKLYRRHLRRCDIDRQGLTPHSARHSAATRILRRSSSLLSVQKLLGHESLDTTSIYLHFDDSDVRKALESAF